MKKFSVKINSYLWLDSDKMNLVERIAPKYVKWNRDGSEDMKKKGISLYFDSEG